MVQLSLGAGQYAEREREKYILTMRNSDEVKMIDTIDLSH